MRPRQPSKDCLGLRFDDGSSGEAGSCDSASLFAKKDTHLGKPSYGGQAVIEGVMIRGQRHFAVAVREPTGKIVVHTEPLKGRIYTDRWFRLPLLRGPIVLWDSLSLGMRSLMFSAKVAMAEEGEGGEKVEMSSHAMWGTMAVALAFAVGLFFMAPALVMSAVVDNYLSSPMLSNLIEKVIRLGLVVGYIAAIGFMPDIRRVFAYHGAEHKAINAYERGVPLAPNEVSRFSTAHPRCGTSFLLVVIVVSFIAFSLLGQPPLLERLLSRVALIPIVAAVAYELIKLGSQHDGNAFVRALLAPGMWLQKLTTREPDEAQVEVAIAAVQAAIAADVGEQVAVAVAEGKEVELSVP